jgi:hypothetical protein
MPDAGFQMSREGRKARFTRPTQQSHTADRERKRERAKKTSREKEEEEEDTGEREWERGDQEGSKRRGST